MIASSLFVLFLFAAPCLAQVEEGSTRGSVRVVRPPEGSMRRGHLPLPEWAVLTGGGVLALSAAGVLALRSNARSNARSSRR